MSDFQIIEPIEILDAMVGSSFANEVLEGDYAEYALATTYNTNDRVIVTERWGILGEPIATPVSSGTGMCSTPTGVIYACDGDDIYKKEPGDDTFRLFQTITNKAFHSMCCDPTTGDVYVTAQTAGTVGDIYKQTGGSGLFASMSEADREWRGICATPDGAIWAAVAGGDLYKLVAGTFTAQSIGNKAWAGMAAAPNGDIYAVVTNGDIWVSTDDGSSFGAIADTDRYWWGIAAAPTGDVFATTYETNVGFSDGQLYKRTAGAGTFDTTGNVTRYYMGICVDELTYDVLAFGDTDVYISRYSRGHKIYESLIDSNTGNYPPYEVTAATPKWLEISATNKWKVFDSKVIDQMTKISPAVYVITPGEAFTSVVLLNVEATTVRIQTDAPVYDQSVSTGATDIVKTDLAGDASSVLTITITNTGGLAKCGEIVIGSAYTLGTTRPYPDVGITDYSVKTQDEWGNWSITERAYSEKMNAVVNVTYSSLDTVIALLKEYRATPLVWIGSSSYACLIVYGFLKDWSVPVSTRGKSILSLQIEGLT